MARDTVNLLQYGVGNIGGALGRLIAAHGDRLSLRYVALADSSGLVWNPEGIAKPLLGELLTAKETGGRLADSGVGLAHQSIAIIDEAVSLREPAVVVDCTASAQMTSHLVESRRRGLHVVLANKLPLVGPLVGYRALTGPAPGALRYEATVGAGLPIIRTLGSLLATHDEVRRIEGCFSGTLGYLFSRLEERVPFSAAVREAWERGYTEPDPRDDLAGWDVARKALILAREVGYELELSQVTVESLFPEEMAALSIGDFVEGLTVLDEAYDERLARARAEGKVVRYVAQISDDACQVGLMAVAQQGRLGSLRGPENMVVFHTGRYDEVPLTIAGPGAGPKVTAAGVLNDILDIAGKG